MRGRQFHGLIFLATTMCLASRVSGDDQLPNLATQAKQAHEFDHVDPAYAKALGGEDADVKGAGTLTRACCTLLSASRREASRQLRSTCGGESARGRKRQFSKLSGQIDRFTSAKSVT